MEEEMLCVFYAAASTHRRVRNTFKKRSRLRWQGIVNLVPMLAAASFNKKLMCKHAIIFSVQKCSR